MPFFFTRASAIPRPAAFLTMRVRSDIVKFSDLIARRKTSTLPGMKMAKANHKAYRQHLLSLRSRLTGDVSHLADEALRKNQKDASGNLSSMPIHMADIGSDNYEQEFTLSLMANVGQALDEIAAALERIDDGSFGSCEECGDDIPKARLEALPYARYCVGCARKLEQGT
jgi:RNA polymerase-binding transcription factor DksA